MTRKKKSKKGIAIMTLILAVIVLGIGGYAVKYYTQDYYLVLNDDDKMTVGLNSIYEEPGAKAVRGGEDISDEVKMSGSVDTSTPGDYEISYECGNFRKTRTVTVSEEMDPVIELNGDEVITAKLGDKIKDPGCTARAKDGTDLTDSIETSEVDFTTAGEHKIEYTVTDNEGKATRIYRTVNIEPNTDYNAPGLPICMFHYVYNEDDPPADLEQRFGNYIGAKALTEEIEWLKSEDYYFPTWDEVRDYVDGKKLLPDKSIVLTFDDGSTSFLECGIPVLEKCQVPATSFVITSHKGKKKVAKYQSEYVDYESHSDNMHRPGGNIGHGGIFTAMSHDDAVADLKKSIEIVGNDKAFAYPYGDFNDSCVQAVKDAGFLCAVTTQAGKVYPGDDPYLLKRQRMVLRQSLETFKAMVRP